MTQGPDAHNPSHGQLLCRLDAIADGGATALEAVIDGETESVIVLREGATARAYLNICPHAGRRLDWAPGRFLLKDGILVCAVHGSSFRVGDGCCVAGPGRGGHLRAVPVTINAKGDVALT